MLINNRPKVLLVQPDFGIKPKGYTYPMGLLYIAQALIKMGIDVSLFDIGFDNAKKFKLDNYLFVGISMMTGRVISRGLHIAQLIKAFNNRIPIVLGGVHPTLLPEESLKSDLVDIVVMGEGEKTVQELAKCLLDNKDLSKIKGIGYKDGVKKIIINPPRELIEMDELDFDLPYELLGKDFFKLREIPLHTSRG